MNNTNKNLLDNLSQSIKDDQEKSEQTFAELINDIHDPAVKSTLFRLIKSIAESQHSA